MCAWDRLFNSGLQCCINNNYAGLWAYFIGKSNENIKLRNVKYVGDIIENAVEFRVPIGPGNVRKP